MSTTVLDPAYQLTTLSQKLNDLESELDEKSGRLEKQRRTLQGLNEDILSYKDAQEQQLQHMADKIQQLQTLQAHVTPLHKYSGCSRASFSCDQDVSGHRKSQVHAGLDEAIATAAQLQRSRAAAKIGLKALQQQARCDKDYLRQGMLHCKNAQHIVSMLDLQRQGLSGCFEMATLICDTAEGVRSECLELDQPVVSIQQNARLLRSGINLMEGKLTHTENLHLKAKSEELSKVTELKGLLQTLTALMPCSRKPVPFRSAGAQALHRPRAPEPGTVLESSPCHPTGINVDCAAPHRDSKAPLENAGEDKQIMDCEYFVEEPASPRADDLVSHADQSPPPVVQPSPVVGHQESFRLKLPLEGHIKDTSSANVVMRTVECKPRRQGVVGAAQLCLKEVYQTIDYKGNTRSQCGYRVAHGAMQLDVGGGIIDHQLVNRHGTTTAMGCTVARCTGLSTVQNCTGKAGESVVGSKQWRNHDLQPPYATCGTAIHRSYIHGASSQHMSFPNGQFHLATQPARFGQDRPDPSLHQAPRLCNNLPLQLGRWTKSTTTTPPHIAASTMHVQSIVQQNIHLLNQGAHGVNMGATDKMQSMAACAKHVVQRPQPPANQVEGIACNKVKYIHTSRSGYLPDNRKSAHCSTQHVHRKRAYPSDLLPVSNDRSQRRQDKSHGRGLHNQTSIDRECDIDPSSKPAQSGRRTKHGTKPRARLDVFGGRM